MLAEVSRKKKKKQNRKNCDAPGATGKECVSKKVGNEKKKER